MEKHVFVVLYSTVPCNCIFTNHLNVLISNNNHTNHRLVFVTFKKYAYKRHERCTKFNSSFIFIIGLFYPENTNAS